MPLSNKPTDDVLMSYADQLIDDVSPWSNILVQRSWSISLIKVVRIEKSIRKSLRMCIGNEKNDDSCSSWKSEKNELDNLSVFVDIIWSHRLDFIWDCELWEYLPSADSHTDISIELALKWTNWEVKDVFDNSLDIITDPVTVIKRLSQIVEWIFGKTIINSFLNNQESWLTMPCWNTVTERIKWIRWRILKNHHSVFQTPIVRKIYFNLKVACEWFNQVISELKPGDTIYIWSDNEVYILPIWAKSYRMLFFSNNYLWDYVVKGAKKNNQPWIPCSSRNLSVAPWFDGKPFVFTCIWRQETSKNRLFTWEPDIITWDPEKALWHFVGTSFWYYLEIVRTYQQLVRNFYKQEPIQWNDLLLIPRRSRF